MIQREQTRRMDVCVHVCVCVSHVELSSWSLWQQLLAA